MAFTLQFFRWGAQLTVHLAPLEPPQGPSPSPSALSHRGAGSASSTISTTGIGRQ